MREVCCPKACLQQIKTHVQACYPNEGCGLLIGTKDASHAMWRILRIQAVDNLSDRPDRFELDPAVRLKLQRELREQGQGEEILGHYHSHPDHPAEPSACDLSRAEESDLVWVIVSVEMSEDNSPICREIQCYVAKNTRLNPCLLRVIG